MRQSGQIVELWHVKPNRHGKKGGAVILLQGAGLPSEQGALEQGDHLSSDPCCLGCGC